MTEVTTIVVHDTETTGLDAQTDSLLEYAAVILQLPDGGDSPDERTWAAVATVQSFVEYEGEIPPGARATHHISPEQVRPGAPNCSSRDSLLHSLLGAELPGEMVYAAHNAPFDMGFLPELTLPWIDTCQCARHIWPDAPGYSNQTLRYWLGVEPPQHLLYEDGQVMVDLPAKDGRRQMEWRAGSVPLAPHRALYDSACTAEILREMLTDHSVEELIRLSTAPILLKTCHLKKHRDTPWAEVPQSYLAWCVREGVGADDPNLRHTIQHYYRG